MRDAGRMLADLEEFVRDHHSHGSLTADATEPAWSGYLLTVACACGWCLSGGSHLRMLTLTF
jgi:hypothetical protein